ncbi:MAG: hypothetical protein QM756_27445 [Polyangiaceae bacterium]
MNLHGFSSDTIARSYLDLVRRGHLGLGARARLLRAIDENANGDHAARELGASLTKLPLDDLEMPSVSRGQRPDYVELAAHHGGGKNRRRPGQRFG